jgi:hypothetical protein
MERGVDYETAKKDGFRTDQAIVSFMGSELPKQDQYYYDTNYNSQYIAPNASAYNAALAQSNAGLTPQQITDRNNRAGAPFAKAAAIALGGYVLAPAVAALGAEALAFTRNPVVYCSLNPSACIVAVDTAAAVTAGAPVSGVTLPTGLASTAATEVRTLATTEGRVASAELNVAARGVNAGAAEVVLPGMNRPIRPINADFPPNQAVVDAANSPEMRKWAVDYARCIHCSEIAPKLLQAAGGKGQILEVRPTTPRNLNVFENGRLEQGQSYHQVYTDGRYVYDPRLSPQPIPKGDWEQHIRNINPGGVNISTDLKGLR